MIAVGMSKVLFRSSRKAGLFTEVFAIGPRDAGVPLTLELYQEARACTTPPIVRLRVERALFVSRSRWYCHLKFSRSACTAWTSPGVAAGLFASSTPGLGCAGSSFTAGSDRGVVWSAAGLGAAAAGGVSAPAVAPARRRVVVRKARRVTWGLPEVRGCGFPRPGARRVHVVRYN